jgi:hypothetical protein
MFRNVYEIFLTLIMFILVLTVSLIILIAIGELFSYLINTIFINNMGFDKKVYDS